MDKVLAFSILSASPADVAAGSSWARLSWRGSRKQDEQGRQGGEPAEANQQQQRKEKSPRGETLRPRFAPEFDGIDCFETIVSH